MSSKAIRDIHVALFVGLMVASPLSSLAVIFFPTILSGSELVAICATGILTLGVLRFRYGGCPLTILENNAIEREGGIPYRSNCISYYLGRWIGIHLPVYASPIITVGLMAAPIAVGIFYS